MGGQATAARHSEPSAEGRTGQAAASVEGRYALALYELANQQHMLEPVGRDLLALQQAIETSVPLRSLLSRPLVKREDQARALNALADKLGACPLTKKFVGVLIQNRRLALLEAAIAAFVALRHERLGEITAEITAAVPLTDLQMRMLTDNLQAALKRHVTLKVTEDKTLLGGLAVKIGSRLFDGSLRNKLDRLHRILTGAA